jgi:D-galactarolactone cycloisomerase
MPPLPPIARVDAFAFRVPLAKPIKVAFGDFRNRPMVLVRITDSEGAQGWGEVWSNWPAVGAEHRARLAVDLGQAFVGKSFGTPSEAFDHLTRLTEVLVLQTGEVGPVAQVIAGLDIALWDMAARRAGQPLAGVLSDTPMSRVPVYATGINPDGAAEFAAARHAEGHRAFKLKIGFGRARDLANIAEVRAAIGPDAEFMIDANQSLARHDAADIANAASEYRLRWFEEPLRVDAPLAEWDALAKDSPIALAGGENLRAGEFDTWIARGALKVFQPDITKWGGITGCMRVARSALAAGAEYCPHVFGGGIASLASLHALAASGGSGTLEMDCHPNAGRELILGDLLPVSDGMVPLTTGPGLGAEPDLGALSRHATWTSIPL